MSSAGTAASPRGKKVKWSVSDPNVASIEVQSDGSAMITVNGAGTVDIIAKAGSITGKAPLVVTESKDNDGGGGKSGAFKDKQLSCTNCHGENASATKEGDVEHTPTQTAGYSDEELITIFTKGKKPPGVAQRVMPRARSTPWNAMLWRRRLLTSRGASSRTA